MKKIIIFLCMCVTLSCSGQYWNFQTEGTTDDGNTVKAFGELSYIDNTFSGWVTNSSDIPASLLGVWFQSDSIDVVSDLFVSEPWTINYMLPPYMSDLVDAEDMERFFGLELNYAVEGWEPAITTGETLVFSFMVNESFIGPYTVNGLPDMLFRWQQVGEDYEDSAKTFTTLVDGFVPVVPEPQTIGLIAVFGVFSLVLIRRKFRK